MSITVAQARVLALCFEIFFLGNFVILALNVFVLLRTEARAHSAKLLPVCLALMLILALTHALLNIVEEFLVLFPPEDAGTDYDTHSGIDAIWLARGTIVNFQVLIGDCINVWRLWVVSNRHRLPIALPVLGIAGYLVILLVGSLRSGGDPYSLENFWITACAALTMYTNLHCTAMISWTIYKTRSTHAISYSAHRTLTVIIESGALWTAWIVAFIASYCASSFYVLVVLDGAVPYVGIIFCLVIIQLRYLNYMRAREDKALRLAPASSRDAGP